MRSVRRRDLGIFWFLSAVWSGNWLWIKVGLAGLPPFRFAGLIKKRLSRVSAAANVWGQSMNA